MKIDNLNVDPNKKFNVSGVRKCEICKQTNFLVEHHIEGREVRNANNNSNIANICPNCHYQIHLGLIIIEGKFLTSDGYEIIFHRKDQKSITGEEKKSHLIFK